MKLVLESKQQEQELELVIQMYIHVLNAPRKGNARPLPKVQTWFPVIVKVTKDASTTTATVATNFNGLRKNWL